MVIGLVLMTVFNQFNNRQVATGAIEYSQFIEEVKQGRIAKVVMEGRTLKATTSEGKRITTALSGAVESGLPEDELTARIERELQLVGALTHREGWLIAA